MTLKDIQDKYYNNGYSTKLPYYSTRKKYKDGHVFDETKSVIWNREQVAIENQKIDKAIKAYHEDTNRLSKQLTNDVINALIDEYGFSKEVATKIENKICNDDHHKISSYFYNLEEMADFIQDLMAIENK